MIKRYRCKRTGKEVAAVPSKHTYAMVCEDGHFHSVLEEIFEKGYEEITAEEELKVKVTKLPHEFVDGEKILWRNFCDCKWTASTFDRAVIEVKGFLIGGVYAHFTPKVFCIPFAGNEALDSRVTNCSSGRWPEGYKFPKPEHAFKPFGRVVVRDRQGDIWRADLFSHMGKTGVHTHRCVGAYWKQCLPYNEKTAKLIGTTDDWEG